MGSTREEPASRPVRGAPEGAAFGDPAGDAAPGRTVPAEALVGDPALPLLHLSNTRFDPFVLGGERFRLGLARRGARRQVELQFVQFSGALFEAFALGVDLLLFRLGSRGAGGELVARARGSSVQPL